MEATGSFDVHVINTFSVANPKDLMFVMGIMLMLVAMAFKVSLAPFHVESRCLPRCSIIDYSIHGFCSKIAAFFAFFKVMNLAFAGSIKEWINILGVLVIITLLLANAMGLAQTNAKRMLLIHLFLMQVI